MLHIFVHLCALRFGEPHWKFWATLEGNCWKSDTFGAETKEDKNPGQMSQIWECSLGLNCTIKSPGVES